MRLVWQSDCSPRVLWAPTDFAFSVGWTFGCACLSSRFVLWLAASLGFACIVPCLHVPLWTDRVLLSCLCMVPDLTSPAFQTAFVALGECQQMCNGLLASSRSIGGLCETVSGRYAEDVVHVGWVRSALWA
jgi:hypothetical protein